MHVGRISAMADSQQTFSVDLKDPAPFTLQVVLVGDPQQLPPTVLSSQATAADSAALSQSLFERLQRAGIRVTMLLEQYRMHPDISR